MATDEALADNFTFEDSLEESEDGDAAASSKTARRITNASASLMLGTALFYDGIETVLSLILYSIPYVGVVLEAGAGLIISLFFSLTFYVWFTIKGVRFMKWRRALPVLAAIVVELIPILDILPSRVFSMLIIIFLTRLEDKTRIRIN